MLWVGFGLVIVYLVVIVGVFIDFVMYFGMVWIGVGLVGIDLFEMIELVGVLWWMVLVVYSVWIVVGIVVGYGGDYVVEWEMYFSVIGVGYVDGIFCEFVFGVGVVIGGVWYLIVGCVLMD